MSPDCSEPNKTAKQPPREFAHLYPCPCTKCKAKREADSKAGREQTPLEKISGGAMCCGAMRDEAKKIQQEAKEQAEREAEEEAAKLSPREGFVMYLEEAVSLMAFGVIFLSLIWIFIARYIYKYSIKFYHSSRIVKLMVILFFGAIVIGTAYSYYDMMKKIQPKAVTCCTATVKSKHVEAKVNVEKPIPTEKAHVEKPTPTPISVKVKPTEKVHVEKPTPSPTPVKVKSTEKVNVEKPKPKIEVVNTEKSNSEDNTDSKATHSDSKATLSDSKATHSDSKATHSDSKATHSDSKATDSDSKPNNDDSKPEEKPGLFSRLFSHSDSKATHSDSKATHSDSKATDSDSKPNNDDSKPEEKPGLFSRLFSKPCPPEEKKNQISDSEVRDIFRQSKMFAIPTEMKDPPAILVYLYNYIMDN